VNLTEALSNERAELRKGPRCSLCVFIESLSKDDAQALLSAFDDPSFPHTAISRAIAASGGKINPSTVARHRRGECLQ
jgi:hypothetical protein